MARIRFAGAVTAVKYALMLDVDAVIKKKKKIRNSTEIEQTILSVLSLPTSSIRGSAVANK